jgi:hypothetical protein
MKPGYFKVIESRCKGVISVGSSRYIIAGEITIRLSNIKLIKEIGRLFETHSKSTL